VDANDKLSVSLVGPWFAMFARGRYNPLRHRQVLSRNSFTMLKIGPSFDDVP
jgi:hypothetical protein